MATAIFYASDTGNTESVAKTIAKELGDIEIFDVATADIEKIKEYDKVILGAATWGEGDLSDDWEEAIEAFDEIDLNGKVVALFGLGDQEGYEDSFLDAMGILYEKVISKGATVIGQIEVSDDFEFDSSQAVVDGKFVGLALDEDNQEELSDERIKKWISEIKDKIL